MYRLLSFVAWSLAAPVLVAQNAPPLGPLAPGFSSAPLVVENNRPLDVTGFALDPVSGDSYVAIAHWIERVDATTGARTIWRSFPLGDNVGLLTIQRDANGRALWFSRLQPPQLHRVDLGTGAETTLTVPANTFDLAVTPDHRHVLVSANPSWPSPGSATGIWLVDPNGGAAREVVTLAGPSGPLAFDTDGDLLYAVQSATYPTPPGSVFVVELPASRLALSLANPNHPRATLADTTTMLSGLDGAFDLAVDPRRRRVFVSHPIDGSVRRTSPGTNRLYSDALVRPGGPHGGALGMQFLPAAGTGAPTFDAFQPSSGSDALVVVTNDWAGAAALHLVEPARPLVRTTPTIVTPNTTMTTEVTGLPAGVTAVLVVAPFRFPNETALWTFHGVPLWNGIAFGAPPVVTLPLLTSPSGTARRADLHPGGLRSATALHLQAFGIHGSPGTPEWVSSSLASFTLR